MGVLGSLYRHLHGDECVCLTWRESLQRSAMCTGLGSWCWRWKRPVEYAEDDVMVLCETVREGLEKGRVEECVDGRLRVNFPAEEAIPVLKLGLVYGRSGEDSRAHTVSLSGV
ncbi:hypothetical protein Bca4012_074494 [Brassica carinata]